MATLKAPRYMIRGVEHVLFGGRLMPVVAGGETVTVEQLEERQAEISERLRAIDEQHAGVEMPEEARSEWNNLNEEHERNEERIGRIREERATRRSRIEEVSQRGGAREQGAEFQTARPGATRGDDIYDLSTVRMSLDSPDAALDELRDRALRSVEDAAFPTHVDRDAARAHIRSLIDRCDRPEDSDAAKGEISRRILATGSPTYQRAFRKYLAGKPVDNDETRALALGAGASGGFAVVYTLDPTIIPTSNLSVNPYRRISREVTIAGTNEWRGITSAGVTATRTPEATEASDNSPTLAQPAAVVQRVQTFIPFSIELGQDWGALQTEMAQLIQDAKDDEEAGSFTNGNGTAPNPQGVLTGATQLVTAGGVASFAVADVYALEQALGPRFRPRAAWVGNRFIYNKVRQFDTAGGASLWAPYPAPLKWGLENQPGPQNPNAGNMNADLIGYPANEASPMAAALTTGSKVLILGDFRYFVIVDRIGLDVEVIPHLFGATNRFPTGQRGLFAYWRNTAKVLDANAFRVLVTG